MTEGLKRYYGKGDLHFITFSCYQRRPLLESRNARDLFLRELAEAREQAQFSLVGYVVVPGHVHLLMSKPKSGTPSAALHDLKLKVSRQLRRGFALSPENHGKDPGSQTEPGAPDGKEEQPPRAFWQPRFYDFNVYSSAKVKEKLDYMHANPIQRKLVDHPKDWPWSSWTFYSGIGKVPIPIDTIP